MIDARKNHTGNEQANEVLAWRDYLTTMNDSNFFDLMHMYLGEIQTPYNKQKLIEELSSFLRKEEHKRTIELLLSENDILILNAVYFIPNPTQQKIADFFKDTFSIYQIYNALQNFESRLLIFKTKPDDFQDKLLQIYKINPLLKATLSKYFNLSVILENPPVSHAILNSPANSFSYSPSFFAAVYSLVNSNSSLCKMDGTFKKKISEEMPILFPSVTDISSITLFIRAAKNLGLFIQTENEIFANKEKWKNFAQLPFPHQLIYIAIGSVASFSPSILQKYATQLNAVIESIPAEGFSEKNLLRLAYLVDEKNSALFGSSPATNFYAGAPRLSQILSQQTQAENDETDNSKTSDIFSSIIQNAIKVGIFVNNAVSEDGENLYVSAPCF